MKRILIICFLFVYILSLSAQQGNSVYDFLRFPNTARVSALGGTNVSVVENDVSLVFQNPAFLGQEMDLNLNLNYMLYIADVGAGNVAFAKALGTKSAWGIGVNYVNYGDMKEVSDQNEILESLSVKDIGVNAFFSRDLTEKIRGGVTAKFIYSNFDLYNSIGVAFDLGLSYYDRDNDFSIGLVGKNLGRQIKAYDEVREEMPWDIQFGLTKRLAHAPIRFSITAVHLNTWKFYNADGEEDSFGSVLGKHLVFGAEFIPNDNFWVAIGYNPKTHSDMALQDANKMGGFSVGAGVRVKAFSVGCSVASYHPSATSFMVSLTTSLSEVKL